MFLGIRIPVPYLGGIETAYENTSAWHSDGSVSGWIRNLRDLVPLIVLVPSGPAGTDPEQRDQGEDGSVQRPRRCQASAADKRE